MSGTASAPSPAKINLGLRILGRRPDGYHDIRSIFHEVTLADDVTVSIGSKPGGVSLSVYGADLPLDGRNLAHRAATMFLAAAGVDRSVSIEIWKRIPVAGGLGGGSSNAACVLKLLRGLTGVDPGLDALAPELGSDVPFFLRGGAALVEGRGELVTPMRPGEFWTVLINPGMQSSTAAAYAAWDARWAGLTKRPSPSDLRVPELEWHEGRPFPACLCNDFLPVLTELHPEVAETADALDRCSPCWGLSGSGPTFYALFRTESEARNLASGVPRRLGGIVCRAAGADGASSNR